MEIQYFDELVEQEIQPDGVTDTWLSTACCHAGLVDRELQYIETMVEQHGINYNDQLHCCVVDLLGRLGPLGRAKLMLRASGLADTALSWTALLSACQIHNDVDRDWEAVLGHLDQELVAGRSLFPPSSTILRE